MSSPRLYIAGRDPRDGGGVASMAKFVYSTAEEVGYDPCLVCNMLDRETQIRLSDPTDLLGFDSSESVRRLTVDGMEVKGIPMILPEVEVTQYVLNNAGWQRALSDGDLFFAVAGTNQCCLPLARSGEPFGSWTATLLWDDRIDRLESAPWIERTRDRLSRPLLERIEARTYRAADPVMVLSDYTANRLSERYGMSRDRIEVVPYPIDANRFTPEPTDGDPNPDSRVVLFVGRLNDPRKNTELLIDAFSRIRRDVPDTELWFIGAEPNATLKQAVERSGVDEAIRFWGTIPNDELPRYYRAADVFVIPSNQEGLGIVGLEAMACGTPVVSTRCGGPEQYVTPGETGYLVPPDDARTLGERIRSTLVDSERHDAFGREARRLIEREYAQSKIRERFLDAFEGLRAL